MGRRSNFKREARDFYSTPYEAVLPLLPHVSGSFYEPCAGNGALTRHLQQHGLKCTGQSDWEPLSPEIHKCSAFDLPHVNGADQIISNFPWRREMLHPLLRHCLTLAPVWTLHDANWMFTAQAAPFLKYCEKIVTVGRVKWIEGSKSAGMEDVCWYRIGMYEAETVFIGKPEKKTCEKTKELFSA